jgi:hypothetical protein
MACETATEKPKGEGKSPSKTVKRGMAVEDMEDGATPTAKKLKHEDGIQDGECFRCGRRWAIRYVSQLQSDSRRVKLSKLILSLLALAVEDVTIKEGECPASPTASPLRKLRRVGLKVDSPLRSSTVEDAMLNGDVKDGGFSLALSGRYGSREASPITWLILLVPTFIAEDVKMNGEANNDGRYSCCLSRHSSRGTRDASSTQLIRNSSDSWERQRKQGC